MQVRKANMTDLQSLVGFTSQEAREAEGKVKNLEVLEQGIEKALLDESLARYWVLVDQTGQRLGSVSALREWSDWHAGFYWWVQSLYIDPAYRGKGLMSLLIQEVVREMESEQGLELRLYVHGDNRRAIKAYQKLGFAKSRYEIMVLKSNA